MTGKYVLKNLLINTSSSLKNVMYLSKKHYVLRNLKIQVTSYKEQTKIMVIRVNILNSKG